MDKVPGFFRLFSSLCFHVCLAINFKVINMFDTCVLQAEYYSASIYPPLVIPPTHPEIRTVSQHYFFYDKTAKRLKSFLFSTLSHFLKSYSEEFLTCNRNIFLFFLLHAMCKKPKVDKLRGEKVVQVILNKFDLIQLALVHCEK